MKTPINSVLEEFVNDVGLALGMDWRYLYQPYYDDPSAGLEIEISVYGIFISYPTGYNQERTTVTYGISDKHSPVDWETLRAGLIFFYRLIGQHVLPDCVTQKPCGLTKFAVGMTKAVLQGMRDSRVVLMSFKDGQNDVRFR